MAGNLFCSHIYSLGIKIQQGKDQECQMLKSCERRANYRQHLTDGKAETRTGHQEKQDSVTSRENLDQRFLSIFLLI